MHYTHIAFLCFFHIASFFCPSPKHKYEQLIRWQVVKKLKNYIITQATYITTTNSSESRVYL